MNTRTGMRVIALAVLALLACSIEAKPDAGQFLIGAGIHDVTGEIAEIGFMGYAVPGQKGGGILQRLRARAFIIADQANPNSRIVYVSIDLCMGFQMVKTQVIENLQKTFGNLYTDDNVMLSGTHTHSTPGGIGGTALVDITTFGFSKHNFNAAANGITQAIVRAHNNLQPGVIKYNMGDIKDASINRSPASYLRDPIDERSKYSTNVDTEMFLLRLESTNGQEIGMINWFPVHGVSLNNTNLLVSGDNKGYAAYLFEKVKNPKGTLPGQGAFVAAFGQANEGDVSPNTAGPRCPDGSPCDFNTSTCGGKTQGCIASGPGRDMYESAEIIGRKQYEEALNLYNNASLLISGSVAYRHTYVDMQTYQVSAEFSSTGQAATTCQAALGYSFAAGTTDGPGDFDFTQGTTSPNPFWAWVSGFLAKPTEEQIKCQAPKPILLDVGLIKPIEWVPYILPHQIFRVGQLYIVGVAGEFTTMSGRRLKQTIQRNLERNNVWTEDSHIVIAGLSNSYSHYITTFEEYQQQRYEGASTLYGPHTLNAYQQIYDGLTTALVKGTDVPHGPEPIDMRNHTFSFMPGVIYDAVPIGKHFGDVIHDVQSTYTRGQTVVATFYGANPRNDLQTEKSFLYVDMFNINTGNWDTVKTDGDWETRYLWKRKGLDQSIITLQWTIPMDQEPGTYRLRHVGVAKLLIPKQHYEGTSKTFVVQ